MCFSSWTLSVSSLTEAALLHGICFSIARVLGRLGWPSLCVVLFLWGGSFLPSRTIPAGVSAGMTWPPLADLTLCQRCHLNSIPSHPHRFPCAVLSLQALPWLCRKIPSPFSAVPSQCQIFLHLTQMQHANPFCRYISSCSVHCKNGIYLLQTLPYFYFYFIIFSLMHCTLCWGVMSLKSCPPITRSQVGNGGGSFVLPGDPGKGSSAKWKVELQPQFWVGWWLESWNMLRYFRAGWWQR